MTQGHAEMGASAARLLHVRCIIQPRHDREISEKVLRTSTREQSNLLRLVSWRDREDRPGERADDDRLATGGRAGGRARSAVGERSGHDLETSLVRTTRRSGGGRRVDLGDFGRGGWFRGVGTRDWAARVS